MKTAEAKVQYPDSKDSIIASQAALLAQKDAQLEQLLLKYESLQRQHTTLQHQIEQLIRRIYGRKSEKIDPNQLMFDSIVQESLAQSAAIAAKKEKEENAAAKAETETPATVPAKSRKERTQYGRLPIPEHLERVEIIIDIPEDEKVSAFTGEPLKVIGVEVSEKLEYRPGKLIVNVYKRPQYALPNNEGVVSAALPDSPIARCKADVGLMSHVIVSKFADHLPHYRQDSIFQREKVDIPRGTQSGWLMQIHESIKILLRQQKAKPILDNIFASLDVLKGKTIPSEPLRKAIDYSLNQKEALYRYLENGYLKPDNNTAENAMRPVPLGRKNWLFVGSERGGHAAALYMSLIQSCKNCDINPCT